MSVICQNFVQNAWKKDLCSNCFKSVGDHELLENSEVQENGVAEIKHSPKNGYIKSAVCSPSSPTPQTTWKSLIMNKNEKNNQPFKLETGFKGRLLTINTAVNVFEKKAKSSANVPNYVSKSSTECQPLINGFKGNISKKGESICKSQLTKTDESLTDSGVANGVNGIPIWEADVCKNSSASNIGRKKSAPKHLNNESKPLTKMQNGNISDSKTQITKHSDEAKVSNPIKEGPIMNGNAGKENGALHGILKKSVKHKEGKVRRSGVGFKEEDPVIIGYGGRDFSPEELEWEVASSDGEGGGTSLDETEDDKAFSKITKENTKFNSENVNLLQVSKQDEKAKEGEGLKLGRSMPNGNENPHISCSSKFHEKLEGKTVAEKEMNGTGAEECSEMTKESISDTPHNIENPADQYNNTRHEDISEESLTENYELTKVVTNTSLKEIENSGSCNTVYNSLADNNIPSETSASLVEERSADAVSVTTTTTLHVSGDGCKAPVPDGASIATEYVCAVVKNRHRSASQLAGAADSGSFESETKSGAVPTFDEGFLVSGGNVTTHVSGEPVHEAFNTTLAVLQNMDNGENMAINSSVENTSRETNNSNGYVSPNEITALVDESVEEFADAEETADNAELSDKSECNAIPRVSFLHGSGSDYKEPVSDLSAIYAPGSDFFVARSDSSSSSSSDEQSQRPKLTRVKVTDSNAKSACVIPVETPDNTASVDENQNSITEDGSLDVENTSSNYDNVVNPETSHITITSVAPTKVKPEIPAKPRKAPQAFKSCGDAGNYGKLQSTPASESNGHASPHNDSAEGEIYYSATDNSFREDCREACGENHYAEANIYHEINRTATDESEESAREEGRESKLAALAMELEQVRHSSNVSSKRQAPSPPKIPDPPHEQPPSSVERPPSADPPNSVFRNSIVQFSSASSTTSSSSQDDAGFCSWTLHGEEEEQNKSKWKNSFLLSQYSKCKMLAMGYNDGDKTRTKKKFSLKKLLKIGKESDLSLNPDYNPSNRKAWKYSDNFDRPRPKLDIIHPMDLENKTLTVNPGFDPARCSTSSFTSGVEVISIRNSTSSDYGTYYSDTMSPEESRDANYEYVTPQNCHSNTVVVSCEAGSTSPTPSRCSAYSQASTLTSGSSKNSSGPTGRPPKPPPPPRAHSLQPAGKGARNSPALYKHSISDDQSSSGGSVFAEDSSPLPQAPKRLYRAVGKPDFANYDNIADTKSCSSLDLAESETDYGVVHVSSSSSGYDFVDPQYQPQQYEDVNVVSKSVIFAKAPGNDSNSSGSGRGAQGDSGEAKIRLEKENALKSISTRPRRPPAAKAPCRPPPIYSKLPSGGMVRENAWKTLEASYMALSANNRDVLIKLVEQGMKRRPFSAVKQAENLQWRDFKLDPAIPARFFADGEQVVYDAEMNGSSVTLLITLHPQHRSADLSLSNHLKYPVFAHFYSNIPSHLLLEDSTCDLELDSVQTSIYVLHRAEVTPLESYIQNLPDSLDEHSEKELAFLLLQVIQELKELQVQGIEEVEPCFNALMLAKTPGDIFHSLVFRSGDFYEDSGNAYSLMQDDCKLSLCQYALLLVYQLFKVESLEELSAIGMLKFTKSCSSKVFENVASLLSEEKAVSLSQVKTLLECFIWGVQALVAKPEFDINEADVILHRWIDLERSNLIKHMIYNPQLCINMHLELHSQFLIRSNVRNIKDALPFL